MDRKTIKDYDLPSLEVEDIEADLKIPSEILDEESVEICQEDYDKK
ncbi:hypothetical protein CCACVL1_23734 [Corchorus capsularis]|uniref:Uncharacterized protein n=1 Tax=Corchorus capsularis TaxID=210143 RepID=A0A1R3GSV2_COCAP|nr:hypothetical protein CCACVL1_23734 [Corchorus capsularis]